MKALEIAKDIYWVGAIDWDVRIFHGYETPHGTTYNAYLVVDEQVTLIDTVKSAFTDEMIARIESVVPLSRIDNIISNHVEPDHSGALTVLAEKCPNATIYTSPNGEKGLRAYYAGLRQWEFKVVKTGDSIQTGRHTFNFVLMPMVHWPDSMATYMEDTGILFSNDAFGQHIASEERFDGQLGRPRLLERAGDYYANIVLPFGMQVNKVLGDVSGLAINMICPSHGVIIRDEIPLMTEKYAFWAGHGVDKQSAVIVYDSMWGATRLMAGALKAELEQQGMTVREICLGQVHFSQAMTALLEAGTICVGSSTLNRNMMPTVAAFLCYMKGLAPKNRVGLAFGAYGWSGESIGMIEEQLKGMGFDMLPSRKVQWWPE